MQYRVKREVVKAKQKAYRGRAKDSGYIDRKMLMSYQAGGQEEEQMSKSQLYTCETELRAKRGGVAV